MMGPPANPPAPPAIGAPPSTGAAPAPAAPTGGPTACSNCGTSNPAGFRFCGGCGAKLGADPAPVEDVGSANTVFVDQAPPELQAQAAAIAGPGTPAPGGTAAGPAPTAANPTAGAPSPAPTPSLPKPTNGPSAKLVMLGPDGSPIGERVLAPGETLEIGRSGGPPWDEDAYLDKRHGNLTPTDEGILVEDFDSLNGIFVKLTERAELRDGDQFRVGQELLRYEDLPEPTPTPEGTERMGSPNPGYWGRLSLLVDPDASSEAYPIEAEGVMIGREDGDITFPQDGYVSSSHCKVSGDDSGVYVEDVGSSNGTYMRVRTGAVLPYGSLVLIGQKLFQFERV